MNKQKKVVSACSPNTHTNAKVKTKPNETPAGRAAASPHFGGSLSGRTPFVSVRGWHTPVCVCVCHLPHRAISIAPEHSVQRDSLFTPPRICIYHTESERARSSMTPTKDRLHMQMGCQTVCVMLKEKRRIQPSLLHTHTHTRQERVWLQGERGTTHYIQSILCTQRRLAQEGRKVTPLDDS